MPTIESRVVEMRFDNKQFEENAQQSMGTIEKLNKSLDFDKTSKSLDKLSDAGKKFSLKGIEVALQTVTEKFSALEIAGMQVIANLTDRMTNMGVSFVKSMTTDLIGSGWDKYAQKTSAIQTIMSATAKDIENVEERMKFVNTQIEKLNWFTDETSYSLLDMTNNIGKFTSNGIKLDDAATQMQGISVWASLSGASLSDASRAMYNLSQAMSSGQVKAIDWMSIENANMATREFKETAIQTAVEVGTLVKVGDEYYDAAGKAIDVTKDFRGSLAKGWFTSDVLGKTLNKFGSFTDELYKFTDAADLTASEAIKLIDAYAGVGNETFDMNTAMVQTGLSAEELTAYLGKLSSAEMDLGKRAFKAAQEAKTFQEAIDATSEAVASGWMQTFEYIFGDYLHAKENWTNMAEELYNLFAEPGNARNTILKYWSDEFSEEGGYGSLMRAIGNAWEGIKIIGGTFRDAFDSVFDPFYNLANEGEQLLARANWLTEFTKKIESFTESFKLYFEEIAEEAEVVTKPIEETVETVTDVVDTISATKAVLDDLANQTIRGDFGNGEERVQTLRDLGYSYELVQNRVNELLGVDYRYEVEAEKVAEATKTMSSQTASAADAFKDFSVDLDVVEKGADRTTEQFNQLHGAINNERSMSPAQRRLEILRRVLVDIFEVADWGKRIVTGLAKVATHIGAVVLQKLEKPLWNFLDVFTKAFDAMNESLKIGDKITAFFDGLLPIIDIAADSIEKFFSIFTKSTGFTHLVDSIKQFASVIGTTIGKIFGTISAETKKIDWVYTFDTILDKIGKALEFVADQLGNALDYISDHWSDVENFFSIIATGVGAGATGIIDFFRNLWDVLKNSDFSILDNAGNSISGFFDKIDFSTLKNAGKALGDFGKYVIDLIKNFDIDRLTKLAATGGLGALGYMIYDFCKNISKGLTELSKIPKGINNVIDGYASQLKSIANEKNSVALLNIAKSIGIFTLSLIGISFIDPASLERVTGTLVIIMGMFALLMAIYVKLKNTAVPGEGIIDKILAPIKSLSSNISKTFKEMGNIAKIGIGLVAIVAAVGLLGMIGKMLSEFEWGAFLKGAAMITIIGALLILGARQLEEGARHIDLSTGLALIGMAASILLISKAIEPLSKLDIPSMSVALLGIIGVMGGLSMLAQDVDGTNLVGFSAGMLIFAAAMVVLTPAIAGIGLLPVANILKGVGAIAAVAAVMGGIGVLMAMYGGAGTELLKLSAALLILSAPLLIIGLNAEAAAYGLLLIAGALGTLLLAGFAAQFVSVGLIALTDAAIGIGVGALAFGAGMLMIAMAIRSVALSIPIFINSMIFLGKAIQEHGNEIIAGFGAVLIGVATAIADAAVPIAMSVLTVILRICDQIVTSLPTITGYIFQVITGVLIFLASIVGQIINSLIVLVVAIINGVADGIRNNAPIILAAVVNLLDSIWDLLVEFIASIVEMVPVVGGSLADMLRGAKDWVDPAAADTGQEVSKVIKENTNVDGLGAVLEPALNNEIASVDASEGTGILGDSISSLFGEKLDGSFATVMESGSLENIMSDMLTGSFDGVVPDIDTGAEMLSTTWIDGMGANINNGEVDVQSAMSSVINTAGDTAATDASNRGNDSGNNWVKGLVAGIMNSIGDVEAAGAASGAAADRGYRNATLTKSPSRLAEKLGGYWDMGLANGITDNLSLVEDAGEKSGNSLFGTLKDTVHRITDWINSDMDMNPTITPVLDLSSVENGLGYFDGMFGQRSMNLAFAGANITARDVRLSEEMTSIKRDISDLSKSIDNLADSQMNQTYEFVANTQLDGRNIARSTARYNRQELALLDRNANRKGGKVR